MSVPPSPPLRPTNFLQTPNMTTLKEIQFSELRIIGKEYLILRFRKALYDQKYGIQKIKSFPINIGFIVTTTSI